MALQTVTVEFLTYPAEDAIETHMATSAELQDQMDLINVVISKHQIRGQGVASFTVVKKETTVAGAMGNVVIIKNNGTAIYKGYVINRVPDYTDSARYSDKVHFTCDCEIVRGTKTAVTLKESDDPGADAKISTTADALYQFVCDGTGFGSKETGNSIAIVDNCNVTYSHANNTLPAQSLNTFFDSDSPYEAMLEQIDIINGGKDLTSVEPTIVYVDNTNVLYTKVREDSTTPLASFDIGDYSTDTEFMYTSEDLENLIPLEGNIAGIRNRFIVNGTIISSTQYATEENASRIAHGIIDYVINDENIAMDQLPKFWDGVVLRMINPLIQYKVILKPDTYQEDPFFPTNIDGYIELTKDGSTEFVTLPLLQMISTFNSGGWKNQELIIGEERPSLNTRRIQKRATKETAVEDLTSPNVSPIKTSPVGVDKTYTRVDSNFYLGCYARDDTGVTSVDFFMEKLNISTNVWGAKVNLGSGSLQAAPDANDEEFWQLTADSGFKDLTASPADLVIDDVFRIVITATDAAGNKGVAIDEYQLGTRGLIVTSSLKPAVGQAAYVTTNRKEFIEGTKALFELKFNDRSVDSVVVEYYQNGTTPLTIGGELVTVNNEYLWRNTDDIDAPDNGEILLLVATITDTFGHVKTELHTLKGKTLPAMGVTPTVSDPTPAVDDEDISLPQYKAGNNIRFELNVKKEGYKIKNTDANPDFQFLLYNQGSSSPDLTIKSGNPLEPIEDIVGNGKFYWEGAVNTLTSSGLSAGFIQLSAATKQTEDIPDVLGMIQNDPGTALEEGEKVPFEIVSKTVRTRVIDEGVRVTINEDDINTPTTGLKDRMDVSEKKNFETWYNGTSFFDSESKHFTNQAGTDPAPDGGGAGYFGASDNSSPSNFIRFAADPTGTISPTFEINHNDTSESVVVLIMTANSGGNKGAIQYDYNGGTPTMQFSTKYQDSDPGWADFATGATEVIQKDVSGTIYEARVDSDGGFTYRKKGAPDIDLFDIDILGEVTIYNNTTFDDDDAYALGTGIIASYGSTKRIGELFAVDIYTAKVIFTNDGTNELGRLEHDPISGKIVQTGILMGFKKSV